MRDRYVPNLKAPGRKKPSRRMALTIALCIVLPPVGLILLWGGVKCPLRGKLILTAVSALILVMIMTAVLEKHDESSIIVSPPTAAPVYVTPEPSSAPVVPAAPESVPAASSVEAETAVPAGVIPANPMN